jgi:hypothetical protein
MPHARRATAPMRRDDQPASGGARARAEPTRARHGRGVSSSVCARADDNARRNSAGGAVARAAGGEQATAQNPQSVLS